MRDAGIEGRIAAMHVWPAGVATPVATDLLELDWGGPVGDRHHGVTMRSDIRQRKVYPEGTEIANYRQLSVVSVEELAAIAAAMAIDSLAPGTIADNITLDGVPDLTALPIGSRLVFAAGAVLLTHGANTPCTLAGAMVAALHATTPQAFPKAAIHRRGIVASVERPGCIAIGEAVRVIHP